METRAAIRLLVVDDEDVIRELLSDFLGEEGFAVTTAADAEEGLRLFSPGRFDTILVDYTLPGMNGLELCHRVSLLDSQVVLLLMTGLGGSGLVESRPYIRGVIAKPFDLFAVVETLRSTQASSR